MSAIAQRRTAAAAAIMMLFAVLQYVLFAVNPSPANAAGPEPTYGTAVVDGDISEWDLVEDHFSEMYVAGNPTKPVIGDTYLRYDCETSSLFVLALSSGRGGESPGLPARRRLAPGSKRCLRDRRP